MKLKINITQERTGQLIRFEPIIMEMMKVQLLEECFVGTVESAQDAIK